MRTTRFSVQPCEVARLWQDGRAALPLPTALAPHQSPALVFCRSETALSPTFTTSSNPDPITCYPSTLEKHPGLSEGEHCGLIFCSYQACIHGQPFIPASFSPATKHESTVEGCQGGSFPLWSGYCGVSPGCTSACHPLSVLGLQFQLPVHFTRCVSMPKVLSCRLSCAVCTLIVMLIRSPSLAF